MNADVAVIGAGIAGATIAADLAPAASVMILEAEDQPGYHATGRSAAFWSETYGGPAIQPLTTASGPMLQAGGYLQSMGSLHVGRVEDDAAIEAFLEQFDGSGVPLERVDPRAFVPRLREGWQLGVHEPSCAFIDVARLHMDRLAAAKRSGARLVTSARVRKGERVDGRWRLETDAGEILATIVVNAAGAWADSLARTAGVAPLGIAPFRRTMVQVRTRPAAPGDLPLVADIKGGFYFKPETGGRLWVSPHDEIATDPCDAQAEELDVATAIDRFEGAVDWQIEAVERRWAGLRSFAPDRLPVYGFDPAVPGFFWFAGQGGFGIQTAPAAAAMAASLITGAPSAMDLGSVDPELYAPTRFRS